MIQAENLTKSFGGQLIFDSVSFNVNKGERVGLVGRNGHGKTTLFKIIIGSEPSDIGNVIIPKNYSLGYVQQELHFTEETALKECTLGIPSHYRDESWRAEKILSGLGFNETDQNKNPNEFSDGYQIRINLAKTLVSEPDLILLDEPTNYLDVISIRWLERYLQKWKGELILITHDRSFMDAVTTHTLGIHRQRLRKVTGSTEKLYEQILKEEEIYEKTRVNDEKKKKEVELFINRFRAKARLAGLVQSRVKSLEKQTNLEKLDKLKILDFNFNYKLFNAKNLMDGHNLSFSYDKKKNLIEDFNINIGKHDRIAVIGKNGKGKTTLLKLLSGKLKSFTGEINKHSNTLIAFYDQDDVKSLNNKLTVLDEISLETPDTQRARDICGALMFEDDYALKNIKVLSGGEKSRVVLGKIIAKESNLLLLDEPTNHLDMESCDALMGAIDEFDGAVVFVTHNELFLHSLANKFVIFQGDKIISFIGTYQDFLNKIGWEEEEKGGMQKDDLNSTSSKKEIRKKKAEIQNKKNTTLKPLKDQMVELENQINDQEIRLESLTQEMISLSGSGTGEQLGKIQKEFHNLKVKIDSLYDSLEDVTTEYEKQIKIFQDDLDKLE